MLPEANSRKLFGITRSKGKMFEFGLPEAMHLELPRGAAPQDLLLLTVGILGDVAAEFNSSDLVQDNFSETQLSSLGFAASYFDALVQSKYAAELDSETGLLGAAAYYLAGRPGSSLVLARARGAPENQPALSQLLHWLLLGGLEPPILRPDNFFGDSLPDVASLLSRHFMEGSSTATIPSALAGVRDRAYSGGTARQLLSADIVMAVARRRIARSAWTTLPAFTGLAESAWASAVRRSDFPKELWPSQLSLGRAGIFAGTSGVVQMPTSAGKTRSVEIVLRSAFLGDRTSLAMVVAPFRSLCHEIGADLRRAFLQDDVKVNEVSDALQVDLPGEIDELLGMETPAACYVLVITPEKLLFLLRQAPALVERLGLVVYDEGHQFDNGSRGITYELLLAEIRSLLPSAAQTLLISAVVQNANAIGDWLIGSGAEVVDGRGILPTYRTIALASWTDRLGQLQFFEQSPYTVPDYFVPRVIEAQVLALRGSESKQRMFPERESTADVGAFLGLQLVSKGEVAIFCGRKDSANAMARRIVEVFERGLTLSTPEKASNGEEVSKLRNLCYAHLGASADTSRAAALGVFVHHRGTPEGIRLSIEYGMRKRLIRFVVCTSTLAQGVNLPIRYLIVTGTRQGSERIKARDFHNLMGRAGRAGVHTEGTVIFADTKIYDSRSRETWRLEAVRELLNPDSCEATSSSLLGVIAPVKVNRTGALEKVPIQELCALLLAEKDAWTRWTAELAAKRNGIDIDQATVVSELRDRRHLMQALESYLMANRGLAPIDEFVASAQELAKATLAHHLADEIQQADLLELFVATAKYLDSQQPSTTRQVVYSKTLLGVERAKAIETFVADNVVTPDSADSNSGWLEVIWPLLFHEMGSIAPAMMSPDPLAKELTLLWLGGGTLAELVQHAEEGGGTRPWGSQRQRKLRGDDVVAFCEEKLAFESGLIVSAAAHFILGRELRAGDQGTSLGRFQKALKYGLPDNLSISCYEYGYADRVAAQRIRDALLSDGYSGELFPDAIERHSMAIDAVVMELPSYFSTIRADRK
jgi:hypothetical protein